LSSHSEIVSLKNNNFLKYLKNGGTGKGAYNNIKQTFPEKQHLGKKTASVGTTTGKPSGAVK
jgi:hypothetical protein